MLPLLLVTAFLVGSIPTANIFARRLRGVDLRGFGSGAVTTSNAGQVLGKKYTALIGVLDGMKGIVPTAAAFAAGLSQGEQMAVGAAAMAGHNWSPWLRFEGGRGLACLVGVLLVAAPLHLLILIASSLIGLALLRNNPLVLGISVALLPVWGLAVGEGEQYVLGSLLLTAIAFLKRATGNRLTDLPGAFRDRVLLYRLLYDRDVKDRRAWVRRQGA
jgi:glycerol-3-phosphate acyltransferase PlsY